MERKYFIISITKLRMYDAGAAKSIVRIAQVVPQPVPTSGNFQEFTIEISYRLVRNTSSKKQTSKSKSDFAGPGMWPCLLLQAYHHKWLIVLCNF